MPMWLVKLCSGQSLLTKEQRCEADMSLTLVHVRTATRVSLHTAYINRAGQVLSSEKQTDLVSQLVSLRIVVVFGSIRCPMTSKHVSKFDENSRSIINSKFCCNFRYLDYFNVKIHMKPIQRSRWISVGWYQSLIAKYVHMKLEVVLTHAIFQTK